MPKRKRAPDEPGAQSQRFLDAVEKTGADKSRRKFDQAFRRVVTKAPPRKSQAARNKP